VTQQVSALVVAAGSGERMGGSVPKAFLTLAGRPLLWHCLQAFATAEVRDVVVVTVEERRDEAVEIAAGLALESLTVCAGGETRAESVSRGLQRLAVADGVVAVHDAARPLVTPALIRRTLDGLHGPWAAVAPALPVVDTLKLVEGEQVVRTVDRAGMWAVQTPQVFGRRVLEEAHEDVRDTSVTDDLALVEQAGGRVRLVEGERRNFKITYPEDLAMAEALVAGA
jgi:2-C-methyl-D-erythritol 4-phosphate cytidylyltransferase